MSTTSLDTAASRLDRMLQDPLIRLVMASDRVEEADIRRLADRIAGRPAVTISRLPSHSQWPHAQGCAGRA